MLDREKLEMYWSDIPIGKENAISYSTLCFMWCKNKRDVRSILHDLSLYDNGDNYVLIRSGASKGFYKTDDEETIRRYRLECLNKGRSIFAPVRKCNRVLQTDNMQFSLENNLRVVRTGRGLTQKEVCERLCEYNVSIDEALLSKFENSVALPNPIQLYAFAEIYGVLPDSLLGSNYLIEVR